MTLSFDDPLFRTYAIAAAVMVLKLASQSWMTILRMVKVNGGFRSPEDTKKTPFNPKPSPEQLNPNDYVDRSRRVHANDVENILPFLVIAFLFVLAEPALWVAQLVLYGYVVTRLGHSIVYLSARTHDARAMFWMPGSFAMIGMAVFVLVRAIS